MLRRHPILSWAIAAYVTLMLLGALLFEPFLLPWPHLFLLALQKPLGSPDDAHVWIAIVLGVVPVMLVVWQVERRRQRKEPDVFQALVSGCSLMVATLLGLTFLAFLLAWILGWPAGV